MRDEPYLSLRWDSASHWHTAGAKGRGLVTRVGRSIREDSSRERPGGWGAAACAGGDALHEPLTLPTQQSWRGCQLAPMWQTPRDTWQRGAGTVTNSP